MQKFKDALREEQKRLEEIIAKAKKENEHMPEGNLRISKHKNRCRYYHCVHDRNDIYIPKRNMILREQLAQKAYNSSIYWEHEGMMDKQEYARNAVRKIELYQKNGIYPGERLILTFETEQSMLNQNILEKLVEKYL